MEAPANTESDTRIDLRQTLLRALEQLNLKVDTISEEQNKAKQEVILLKKQLAEKKVTVTAEPQVV